ncbi:hypothetical protein F0562_024827 [Nyssa sinensis]|uniref:RING-type E3 ubiquitin transferase n=1 Tax=Nyssa sinensis TaxID=561372 RepID=A0A5J5BDW8_9ASTE|nr:hypothetical protein F0562_024827 [Nyssa sinensis]
MGGNGKQRWKISIRRSSSSKRKEPPKEFLCPISGCLMFDPVVVSSGQTFERTTVIPNLALKSTILKWCDNSGTEHPRPPDSNSVENTVHTLMESSREEREEEDEDPKIRVSERELLSGVAERPPVLFSHAATELNHRANHFYSSSSEESVIANVAATPLLPFTTRPVCYSSTSSTSTSSEIASEETLNPNSTSEDEEFVVKLKSQEPCEQEQGVTMLRKITRTKEETRVPLCTPRLLSALRSLLVSRYPGVQTNAVAALVNLSLPKVNKVKIVRSGVVPPLIDVLKGGIGESQEHAAGALFSLALEDDNRTAIGVLGALQPLLHALRSESERTRQDSAVTLYHLSLVQSNRVKLLKLGAVPTLLEMVRSGDVAERLLLVLGNLAACAEGKSAMLDANAVECLVEMLRRGSELDSESTRESCVAVLYSLSHGSMRFKGLARDARVAEVLREVEERGSERAREKAKRILAMLRGRDEEEVDWEGMLEGGAGRTRYRVGRNAANAYGANSTEF